MVTGSIDGRPPEYLGDGVYLDDDGYQLWLFNNHHENRVIALDPDTWAALLRYGQARWMRMKEGDATK